MNNIILTKFPYLWQRAHFCGGEWYNGNHQDLVLLILNIWRKRKFGKIVSSLPERNQWVEVKCGAIRSVPPQNQLVLPACCAGVLGLS